MRGGTQTLWKLWEKLRFGFYRIDEVILNGKKTCDVCTSLHWTWEGSCSQSYLSYFSLFIRNMWKILDSDFQMNFHMKDSHEWKNVSYNVGNSLRTWGGLMLIKWYFFLSVRFCGTCKENPCQIFQVKTHSKWQHYWILCVTRDVSAVKGNSRSWT